jgi:type III pantothenate kinase
MNETEQLKDSEKILYIDIGNSMIKVKTFRDANWVNVLHIPHKDVHLLEDHFLKNDYRYNEVILSSVVKELSTLIYDIFSPVKIYSLNIQDISLDKLDYESPETLGIDRYLACLGACYNSGGSVIVIDAGTACTIDYMDENSVFRGGVIMPGLRMLENGLQQFAPALPPVERSIPDKWPGKSTIKSLQWGITGVFMDAINMALDRYHNVYGSFSLWLTGGDAQFIQNHIDRSASINSNLVFEGMKIVTQSIQD